MDQSISATRRFFIVALSCRKDTRFLVLYSTIAMVFAYAVLARVEERISADAFADYDTYLSSTGGFFPKLFVNFRSPRILSGLPRVIVLSLIHI